MNELKVFDYNGAQVRTVELNGEPWWVLKDVCEVFGETNYRRVSGTINPDEKGVSQIDTPGGKQEMTVVNEAGLYSTLFSMQPSKARGVSAAYIAERENKLRDFRRWVTHEVLPSIRKHGMYATPATVEAMLGDPDTMIKLLLEIKNEREARKVLEGKVEQDAPKVLFADAVSASDGTILIGDLAKLLHQNGMDIGQKRLFQRLRDEGYLIRSNRTDYNMPTQRAMEMGLFRVKETAVTHADGHVSISRTTKVTGKGQQYFINRYLGTTA